MRLTVQLAIVCQLAGVCLASQPIGILFDFGTKPQANVVDFMQTEIRDILAPAHMDLSFQRIGDSGASQVFRKIVIVHFHGSCEARSVSGGLQLDDPDLLEYPALGKTDIANGHIMPYVQVYCNELRAFIPSITTMSAVQMYGRALGRVVAHELYHALLSTRDHSRSGVARFAQTARDLTREKLPLDSGSIDRLRNLYGAKKEGDSEEPPSTEPNINTLQSQTVGSEDEPQGKL